MRFGGVTGPRGQRGGAPRRLNVGNMLDVDRSPKCCFNMFNIGTDPPRVSPLALLHLPQSEPAQSLLFLLLEIPVPGSLWAPMLKGPL